MTLCVKNNLDDVLKKVRARAQDSLRKVGPLVLKSAIRKCPVDTGNLQRSIEPVYEPLKLIIGSREHYAAYVEGGTEKMAAQPYLRPALMENLQRIKKVFKTV